MVPSQDCCLNCGHVTRALFGGWCITCAGPVDYPWWCEHCEDYVHVDAARDGRCPLCEVRLTRCDDAQGVTA